MRAMANPAMVARHLRDEAAPARRCRRSTPKRVRRSWTQSRRPVRWAEQRRLEHVLDCAGHWGEGCCDYRGGVGHQGRCLKVCWWASQWDFFYSNDGVRVYKHSSGTEIVRRAVVLQLDCVGFDLCAPSQLYFTSTSFCG